MNMERPHAYTRDSRRAVALMYHALSSGHEFSGHDAQYTLTLKVFSAQLDLIERLSGGVGCARDWLAGVSAARALLTFDDGHLSDYNLAYPVLRERGIRADFFVNPARVGTPGFASWSQLRTMAGDGMSIQSHGYDHVYLTHLEPDKLAQTLVHARKKIEDGVGKAVTLLAPPGGRMPSDLVARARDCGYIHVLSSRPGRISAAGKGSSLPRMAVTSSLTLSTLSRWLGGGHMAFAPELLRYATLAMAKQLIGDTRYERLRARALTGAEHT